MVTRVISNADEIANRQLSHTRRQRSLPNSEPWASLSSGQPEEDVRAICDSDSCDWSIGIIILNIIHWKYRICRCNNYENSYAMISSLSGRSWEKGVEDSVSVFQKILLLRESCCRPYKSERTVGHLQLQVWSTSNVPKDVPRSSKSKTCILTSRQLLSPVNSTNSDHPRNLRLANLQTAAPPPSSP